MPDSKNSLDASFDYVIETSKVEVPNQTQKVVAGRIETEVTIEKVYKGVARKVRGERMQQIVEMVNPWKSVIKPFCRKYLNKECENGNEK